MKEIRTARLHLRPFRETDYDDLFEFLSQLENDEFEGYPGITYENGRKYLADRVGSEEFYAIESADTGRVIGNIYCGNRDYGAKEVGFIVTSVTGARDTPQKRFPRLLRTPSGKESTGYMRNATHGIPARGSCWKRWD